MSQYTKDIAAATGAPECVVVALLVLAKPQRQALKTLLNTTQADILEKEGEFVGFTTQANTVSTFIGAMITAMEVALSPIDSALSSIPFAEMAQACPTMQDLFNIIVNNISITLPAAGLANYVGLGGFDLFEGVNSFTDLKRKVRELAFRAQQATRVSNYANTMVNQLNSQLQKIGRAHV